MALARLSRIRTAAENKNRPLWSTVSEGILELWVAQIFALEIVWSKVKRCPGFSGGWTTSVDNAHSRLLYSDWESAKICRQCNCYSLTRGGLGLVEVTCGQAAFRKGTALQQRSCLPRVRQSANHNPSVGRSALIPCLEVSRSSL